MFMFIGFFVLCCLLSVIHCLIFVIGYLLFVLGYFSWHCLCITYFVIDQDLCWSCWHRGGVHNLGKPADVILEHSLNETQRIAVFDPIWPNFKGRFQGSTTTTWTTTTISQLLLTQFWPNLQFRFMRSTTTTKTKTTTTKAKNNYNNNYINISDIIDPILTNLYS